MMQIRPERPADRDAVHRVEREAFGQPNEADLARILHDTVTPVVSLVAEDAGSICGHVIVSPVTLSDAPTAPPLGGLGPIGVLPDRQGQGIGGALVEAALASCRELGWEAVFLVGDPRYYVRFGLQFAAPMGFRYGHEQFDPVLQVVELRRGTLEGLSGLVQFHPAFAEHE